MLVINHKFGGTKGNESININGEYDINIWYSYDNDTKTDVFREKNTYTEIVKMRSRDDINGDEEVIVRSLKQPSCTKIEIDGDTINYSIEKVLGVELVGDVKFKIEANDEEDPWDEIVEENKVDDIDKAVNENYLDEV